MTRAPPSRQVPPRHLPTRSGARRTSGRCQEPPAISGVRAASKTDEQDNLHMYSDPYGRESADVQRRIATVTPGTASYRGRSRTGAIITGTATYKGGSQQMSNGGSQLSPQAQHPIGEGDGPELSPQAQQPLWEEARQ